MSKYQVVVPSGAQPWGHSLGTDINVMLGRLAADMKTPRLTVAQLPTDNSIRTAIVTDEVGGEVLAFLDSAGAWRRCTDRVVVS